MRGIGMLIVVVGLTIGAVLTFSGLLAPLFPSLEMANHFRPFILTGFIVLLAITLVMRLMRWLILAALFAALNAALFVLPLTFQASAALPAGQETQKLKIVSFNIWVGNRPLAEIEQFLRTENADVVLLQEIDAEHADNLLPALKDIYPHQVSCARSRRCRLALLSQHPWSETGHVDGSMQNPALIWARYGTDEAGHRVAGVHHAWPFQAEAQVNHTDWLIAWRKSVPEPLLVAGDFNLTPFSWKLSKFAWQTGLKRFSTYQRSWPGHRYAPVFLIDHIFASDTIRPVDVQTGPPLGSDHLPVIATVALQAH